MATITTTELATELNTTPRTLRKFLRADAKERNAATPGKGSRYAIEKREVAPLRKRFAKWNAAMLEARAAAAAAAADDANSETETD
jgi:predicted transcriptional regulator